MRGLEQIIADFGPGLARVAASYEADPMLQEDLTQEILFAIHRALPTLEKSESLAPFVFRIAHNRAVTHVVRQAGMRRKPPIHDVDRDIATPEQQLLAHERSERLTRAIRRLPLPYRQVMTLVLEDLSHAEIADVLGLTRTNVGVRVNRAKTQLKVLLDDG